MRILNFVVIGAFALTLAACVLEPQATEIRSGSAPTDRRISYKVFEYAEPYAIQGILASYKLTANVVRVEIDREARINYWGLPDGVSYDLGDAMDATCKSAGMGGLNDVEDKIDLESRKILVYFNCG